MFFKQNCPGKDWHLSRLPAFEHRFVCLVAGCKFYVTDLTMVPAPGRRGRQFDLDGAEHKTT